MPTGDNQFARLLATLELDPKQFQRELRNTQKLTRQYARDLERLGSTLTRSLTVPLGLIGVASTKLAADFDRDMTRIETLVGVQPRIVNEWRQSLLALAPAVGKGPDELAKAMFVVSSAGQRGATALGIVEAAAKASAVGLGETAEIARTVTAAVNVYGDEVLSAERATDILVATVREGNLEADSLAGSLGRVIGIAEAAGVSFAEAGAFIATFTRTGASAEQAVTSLRGVLNAIQKPSKDAQKALAEAGLSFEGIRASIVERGLARTLVDLVGVFDGNASALARVIPEVEALAGVLGTAGAQAETYLEVAGKIEDSAGILEDGFERTKETVSFALESMTASVKVLAIQIGNVLLPTVADFARWLSVAVAQLSQAERSTLLWGVALAIAAAAIGPLVLAVGKLVRLGAVAIGLFARYPRVFQAIGAAFAFAGAHIKAILGVVALLGVALVKLGVQSEQGLGAFARQIPFIGGLLDSFFTTVQTKGIAFARGFLDILQRVVGALANVAQRISTAFTAVFGSVQRLALSFAQGFLGTIQSLLDALADLAEKAGSLPGVAGVAAREAASQLRGLSGALDAPIGDLGERIRDSLDDGGASSSLAQKLRSVAASLNEPIFKLGELQEAIQAAFDAREAESGARDVAGAAEAIKAEIQTLIDDILGKVPDAVGSLGALAIAAREVADFSGLNRAQTAVGEIERQNEALRRQVEATRQGADAVRALNTELAIEAAELEFLREAGGPITEEDLQRIRAAVTEQQRIARVLDESEQAAQSFRQIWRNAAENIQRGIGDALFNAFRHGVSSAKDAAGLIKDIFARLAADIATALVFKPVLQGVLGGGQGGGGLLGGAASLLSIFGVGASPTAASSTDEIHDAVRDGTEAGAERGTKRGIAGLGDLLRGFGGGGGGGFDLGSLFGGVGGGGILGSLGAGVGVGVLGFNLVSDLIDTNPAASVAIANLTSQVSASLIAAGINSLGGSLIGVGINTTGALGGTAVQAGVSLTSLASTITSAIPIIGALATIATTIVAAERTRGTEQASAIVSGVGALLGTYIGGPIGGVIGSLAGGAVIAGANFDRLSRNGKDELYGGVSARDAFRDTVKSQFSVGTAIVAAVNANNAKIPTGTFQFTTGDDRFGAGLSAAAESPFGTLFAQANSRTGNQGAQSILDSIAALDRSLVEALNLSEAQIAAVSERLQSIEPQGFAERRPEFADFQVRHITADRIATVIGETIGPGVAQSFLEGISSSFSADSIQSTLQDVLEQNAQFNALLREMSGETIPQLEISFAGLDNRLAQAREELGHFASEIGRLEEATAGAKDRLLEDFDEALDLELADPLTRALAASAKETEQLIAEARFAEANGVIDAIARAEEIGARRRQAALDQIRDPIEDFLARITSTTASPLAPLEVLGNAEQRFDVARERVLGGDTSGIPELQEAAQALLDVSDQVFGRGIEYFSRFEFVVRTMENVLGNLPGFATGGSFRVPGTGATDSQLVAFWATPGETVTVETPAQQVAPVIDLSARRAARTVPESLPRFARGGSLTVPEPAGVVEHQALRGIQETVGRIVGVGAPARQTAAVVDVVVTQDLDQVAADLPGFATGGSFTVPGPGSIDSQLVSFWATPGEVITVQTAEQASVLNLDSVRDRSKRGLPAFQDGGELRVRRSTPGASVVDDDHQIDLSILRETSRGNDISARGFHRIAAALEALIARTETQSERIQRLERRLAARAEQAS